MYDLISSTSGGLDALIAIWLNAKAGRSKSAKTERAYHDTITNFRAALQSRGLDLDSDPQAITLAAQGWAGRDDPAPTTFNQRLAILSSFYTFIHRRNLLPCENPIALVERRAVEEYAGAEALDAEAVRRKMGQIDRTELAGLRDYALLGTYLQTGRRLSEVTALRWATFQLAGELVTLSFLRAKGNKVMRDALSPGLSRALLDWLHAFYGQRLGELSHDAPIWVSLARNTYGRPLSTRSVAAVCEQRLGVSKVHALRHTFASEMEDAGAKVSEIRDRLGHSSLATTGRYLSKLKRDRNPYASELARRFGFDE